MAKSVDDRVVAMSFEYQKFQAGVSSTLGLLGKLSASLKNIGTTVGFDAIEKAANKVGFTGLSRAIDHIKGKFSFPEADRGFANVETASGKVNFTGLSQALDSIGNKFGVLEGAASVALGNIVSKGAFAGTNFAKSFTFAPIQQGLAEYGTNLNAIQTILANTQASGAGLKDVNAALQNLNKYSDQTIYNFSEMAKNIGTFTAAGVDLDTATGSIKGIANLAALSGSNSQQASTAMYQLSQAISSGRVSLQDWNSVVNAGMGGTVFQRALAQTAESMGTLSKGSVELKGKMKNVAIEGKSFRESITAKPGEQSWLTSDVLTKTLQQFTGDLSAADLKAQGFNDSQIKAIQAQAKTAKAAATEVKTLSQVFDVAKETIGSGWSQSFQQIFGNFTEAKKTFTELSNAINGFINNNAKARNKVLGDWKEMGGRTVLIEGIKKVFEGLGSVLKPIKEAFRDLFPAKTGVDLYHLTIRFREFADSLKIGPKTAENLKRAFKGVFAVFDIGKQILSGIFGIFQHLFGAVSDGSGGILAFSGNIGDMLVRFDEWLKKGDKLKNFFDTLGTVIAGPIRFVERLASAFASLFDQKGSDNIASALDNIHAKITPVEKLANGLKKAWEGFTESLDSLGEKLAPVLDNIKGVFDNVGDTIGEAFKNADYDKVFEAIKVGLIGGIFLTIKKELFGGGKGLNFNIGGNALQNVTKSLDTLRGSLQSIQTAIKAHTLVTIATAVALLTASVIGLSLIDPGKLTTAMTAVTVGLGQMIGTMVLLTKAGGGITAAPALIAIATAIDILTVSIVALSFLSWEEIAKGLVGVNFALLGISAAITPLSAASPRMVAAGAGLILVSTALTVLAGAMKIFATMSWEEMGKGLAAVAVSLLAIGNAMVIMPLNMPVTAAGLVLVGIALNGIAAAMKIFGSMSWEDLGKGLVGVAVALLAIGNAMIIMPPTLPITAAGLILVGIALTSIAGAIALMGSMKVSTLAKGIIAIGAALVVLAAGLTLMIASLPGAAALLVAAGALAILVPVLGLLGNMKWSTIFKGLAGIALTLGTLAVAGAVAAVPLLALGIALTALSAGVALVGLGIFLLAKGLAGLGTSGSKGIAVLIAAIAAFIAIIPKFVIDFIKGLVEIVGGIAKLAPQIVDSIVKIISLMVDAGIRLAPKMAQLATALITAFLDVINDNFGHIIDTGIMMLMKLLQGIDDHISEVTTRVANIIIKFLNALAAKIPDLVKAGANVLTKFLEGIANNIRSVVHSGVKIIAKLIEGLTDGIDDVIKAGANLIIHLITGLGEHTTRIIAAGVETIGKFIKGIAKSAVDLARAAADALIDFLNGMAQAITDKGPEIATAGTNVAIAVLDAIAKGLHDNKGRLRKAFINVVGQAMDPTGLLDSVVGTAGDLVKDQKKPKAIKLPVASNSTNLWSPLTDGLPDADAAVRSINRSLAQTSRIFADAGNEWIIPVEVLQTSLQTMATTINKTVGGSLQKMIGDHKNIGDKFEHFLFGAFRKGLKGSTDDIRAAFTDLRTRLKDEQQKLRDQIQSDQKDLDAEKKKKGDASKAVIATLSESLKENKKLLDSSKIASDNLFKALEGERTQLLTLARNNIKVTEQLKEAEQKLDELIQARDDAIKSDIDQYSRLPDVVDPDSQNALTKYTSSLEQQIVATEKYTATLEALRAAGLDDATYKKLLQEGPKDQGFAEQLLLGGKAAIDNLKALDTKLQADAAKLATEAETHLYQAGIEAAQGMVDGLKIQQEAIKGQMEEIADAMVKAIKKKLGIKSPSRVMTKLGRFTAQGMVAGLRTGSSDIQATAAGIGEDAVSAMQNSLKSLHDNVLADVDMNPTITPVLDLSQVEQSASKLAKLFNVAPITAATSQGQASVIDTSQVGVSNTDDAVGPGAKVFKFEQTNNSPKALSEVEIYRQTHNLFSQAKKALDL